MKMHNIRMYIVPHSLPLLFLISCFFRPVVGTCSKTGPCSCQTEDGGKLDLSPISKNDGTPQFVDIPDQRGFDQFSWNPCTPFNEGTAYNVMVVQVRYGVPRASYYSLGTQDSASFSESSKGVILQYSADTLMENTLRTSYFTLICNESQEGQLTALGERGTQAIYDFELRSKYACIQGGGIQRSVTISIGTVLVIVFVSLVFLYLVGGILFQTFVRKATGKDRVPNYDMWRQFPIYVKILHWYMQSDDTYIRFMMSSVIHSDWYCVFNSWRKERASVPGNLKPDVANFRHILGHKQFLAERFAREYF